MSRSGLKDNRGFSGEPTIRTRFKPGSCDINWALNCAPCLLTLSLSRTNDFLNSGHRLWIPPEDKSDIKSDLALGLGFETILGLLTKNTKSLRGGMSN